MNKLEKLFKKITKKERLVLLSLLDKLENKKEIKKLTVQKIKNTDFYKIRKNKFRIIFHYTKTKKIVVDSIKLRNEKTYKNL